MPKEYPELARKLAAATVSHVCGFRSIDLFLKKHVPDEVAPLWHMMAAHIMEQLFPIADDCKKHPEKLM